MGKSPGEASSSSNPAAGGRPPLPVMALREKIVAKVQQNRVTLIVGDTGCGKSSQVPQFLLEENVQPILCTQPRRFAVVVIAGMVAKARNCEVGQEVGYHIGHSNVSDLGSDRSKIVFKTAGVVLEQMRDKGLIALKYKVIILDEVHERSVESDLLLACVKLLMMKNNDMRVVLMSATADITRYKDYFKDLGRGERVEVIAIPNAPQQSSIFQRKVLYLDQVAENLGMDIDSVSSICCSEWVPSDADIKPELHEIIHKLVMHIHNSEPDIEKCILVFLPTYYSLEQQWVRLRHLSLLFKIHILHRSIDTKQALLAMKACQSHRKVILATNIAESSVTIPGVAYVIDSCRSLQIFWDPGRKADFSKLVWVSKSQAEQRKGRTGRTCDGEIYRLVSRSFYNSLNDHEDPAILRLSLRQQVLMVCCSESKAINDPKVLLQKVLDPPEKDIVEDALSLLVKMNALEKPLSSRGRYEPTFYGRLLDSLPLSFDASMLALKFCQVGILREGIIISILMDVQPPPIYHPFGNQNLVWELVVYLISVIFFLLTIFLSSFPKYIDNFFDGSSCKPIAKKEASLMANLCAFQFWERVFKDKHRLERLKHVVNVDESSYSEVLFSKLEEEWCSFHNLIQTSLHTLSEIYEETVEILHRFRPAFLAKIEIPCYLEPYTFKHTCILQSELATDLDALTLEDGNLDTATRQQCIALPYVAPDDFGATSVSEKLKNLVKEMRMQYVEDTSGFLPNTATVSQANEPAICKFFAIGACNKGDLCNYSHSYQSQRPLCRFFHTFQGCRNGNACFFLHDYSSSGRRALNFCLQEDATTSADSFLQLLPMMPYEYVLVLNDNDLFFSVNLAQVYDANKIIATTHRSYSEFEESLGITVLCDVAEPWYAFTKSNEISIPWEQVRCILWFADIEDDAARHYHLLQDLFRHLAVKILADTLFDIRVIITINNVKFAQLQVEKLARECFFFLTESFCFDELSFGKFSGSKNTRINNHISVPVSYVFELYPPTDLQFGDYSTALQKGLCRQ
ncbi:zinc finger CCCH domain-containing protein 4-like isoform X1 [Zingiber officinale]|uniref:zinc finger CCCH domain-containing protein 4-like isoform X1 n=1 Tax=Zingiber officinale TaxID=94328 RepID=UPI001C4B0AF8|nr:zinc finger CCCH domain-containing protein 4-like isoform X1 [Zingiber officinale]